MHIEKTSHEVPANIIQSLGIRALLIRRARINLGSIGHISRHLIIIVPAGSDDLRSCKKVENISILKKGTEWIYFFQHWPSNNCFKKGVNNFHQSNKSCFLPKHPFWFKLRMPSSGVSSLPFKPLHFDLFHLFKAHVIGDPGSLRRCWFDGISCGLPKSKKTSWEKQKIWVIQTNKELIPSLMFCFWFCNRFIMQATSSLWCCFASLGLTQYGFLHEESTRPI